VPNNEARSPSETRLALLPLLIVSVVFLALEILLTRILAYSLRAVLLYIVLGVAMLGSGAAGSLVAVRRDWVAPERVATSLAWAAVAASALIPMSLTLFVRLTPVLDPTSPLALLIAALLTLPFMAAGVVITLALTSAGDELGRCYAVNLVGSGLGCFVPVILLGPVDAAPLLGLLTLLSCAAAALYVRRATGPTVGLLRTGLAVVTAMGLLSVVFADELFPIQPDPTEHAAEIEASAAERGWETRILFDRWNATGRIQVFGFQKPGEGERYPALYYAQDAGAGSMLLRWDGRSRKRRGDFVPWMCRDWPHGHGYYTPRSRVLVIGLGGGPDLQCALFHGAASVDAVEINPDSIRAVSSDFSEWLGGVGDAPNVRFHARDGRSFAHAARGSGYDLIQMSGADTKHALVAGGLALSENHLYTREAFLDYLQGLQPEGVLSIVRTGIFDAQRLANTALAALEDLGVEAPHRHVAVLAQGLVSTVLVRRTPFPLAEITALGRHIKAPAGPGPEIFFFEFFQLTKPAIPLYLPVGGFEAPNRVAELFRSARAGERVQFVAAQEADISATADDRPFFFNPARMDDLSVWSEVPFLAVVRNLMLSVTGLSIVLILLPLARMRERLEGVRAMSVPVYFAGVGLAYMWVEIWLIHRFSMFLGHQVFGLTVVLSTLLVATGAGAHLGHRWQADHPERRARVGVAAIVALLACGYAALPAILESAWQRPLAIRSLVAMGFVVPLGFAMGLPFPAGLAWLSNRRPGAMAWCVGINGFASVFATSAVIPLAMTFGYATVLLCGVAMYLIAALASFTMRSDPA